MSHIFDKITPLAELICTKLELVGTPKQEPGLEGYDWFNRVYYSFRKFRRAHVEVLDKRENNNMWIMHVVIFPHLDDDAPIFGFDIVCTGNKVSGVFHDFSVTSNPNHYLMGIFKDQVKDLKWKKERDLPEWGKTIFSENMIAAGGSTSMEELQQIIDVCINNLDLYLRNIGQDIATNSNNVLLMQNRYCAYQKQNPYPVKMLINFGLTKEQADNFVNCHLFPEVK